MEPKPIAGVDLSEEVATIGHSLPHQLWVEQNSASWGRERTRSCHKLQEAATPHQQRSQTSPMLKLGPQPPSFPLLYISEVRNMESLRLHEKYWHMSPEWLCPNQTQNPKYLEAMACTQVESRRGSVNPEVKFTAALNSSGAMQRAEHGQTASISEAIFALFSV